MHLQLTCILQVTDHGIVNTPSVAMEIMDIYVCMYVCMYKVYIQIYVWMDS